MQKSVKSFNSDNRLFTGKILMEYDQLDSTNKMMLDLLAKSKPVEGTAIFAHHQYAGRGQRLGESYTNWESEGGKNIAVSILYLPKFLAINEQFYLNMAVSLGVLECCRTVLNDGVEVKWPNDICYRGFKLAGILIENNLQAQHIGASVIGIGLNVNQLNFSDNAKNAASLRSITGNTYSIQETLHRLFYFIEKWYLKLRSRKKNVHENYLNNLFMLNKKDRFKDAKGEFEGVITGVKADGHLVVERTDGTKLYQFKEVGMVI